MNLPVFEEFREIYDESGLSVSYEAYRNLVTFGTLGVLIVSTLLSWFIHVSVLRVQGPRLILGVGISALLLTALALFGLLYYPIYHKNQQAKKIDNTLIYTVSYMTVLASSGISFERIMENVAEVEAKGPLKRLVSKFITDVRLLGFPMGRALRDMSGRSPSRALTQLLVGIDNISQTSGDLKSLLDFNYGQLLQVKRQQLLKMLNTLTYIGEIYVTLMVVAPILFIVMLTILSIIGGGGSTGGGVTQLNLLVFVGIPIIAAGFLVLLDTVLGVEE
jgi:archaellum biogenesis protein FlaJ (TadC family)